jgi:hypothetical protein
MKKEYMMMNNEKTYLVRMERKNNIMNKITADVVGMSEHMKKSMRSALMAIGVIIVIGTIGWVSYEIRTIRQSLGSSMSFYMMP